MNALAEHKPHAWEYHTERDPAEADLAALGAGGWELTAIDARDGRFFFKHPAPSFRERVTLEQRTRVFELRAREREAEA